MSETAQRVLTPGVHLALAIGAHLQRLGVEAGCIIEVREDADGDGPVFYFGEDTARALLRVLARRAAGEGET